MSRRSLLAPALFLLLAGPSVAQPQQPVSLIADFHVPPLKQKDFLDWVRKHDQPVFDRLMQEGHVLAWGVDIPVLHLPGAPSHSVWYSMPGMGALDKVIAAFEDLEQRLAAEDVRAAEEARRKKLPVPKGEIESLLEMIDLSQHREWVLRSLLSTYTQAPPPADARPYAWITVVKVRPGSELQFQELFNRHAKPTFDGLVADGSLIGYELGREELKTTDEFTHYLWLTMPDLAAREKVRAAFGALEGKRSPEERQQIDRSFLELIDASATRNYLQRTILLRVAPPR